MVFDRVIGSAREEAGNGGPAVAVPGVGGEDGVVLGGGEGAVLDGGAELVAPAEAAGLTGAAFNVAADQGPVSGAVFVDESGQDPILLGAPRALDSFGLVGWCAGVVGGGGGRGGGASIDYFH